MERTIVADRYDRQRVLEDIDESWGRYWRRITELPRAALIQLTDPAGWTPRDHIDHVRAWEAAGTSLITGGTRHAGLGVTRDEYANLDFDGLNALVRERRASLTLDEVLVAAEEGHRTFVDAIRALPPDGLRQTYGSLMPDYFGDYRDHPIAHWLLGVSVEHYPEHLGYIEVIVGQGATTAV